MKKINIERIRSINTSCAPALPLGTRVVWLDSDNVFTELDGQEEMVFNNLILKEYVEINFEFNFRMQNPISFTLYPRKNSFTKFDGRDLNKMTFSQKRSILKYRDYLIALYFSLSKKIYKNIHGLETHLFLSLKEYVK